MVGEVRRTKPNGQCDRRRGQQEERAQGAELGLAGPRLVVNMAPSPTPHPPATRPRPRRARAVGWAS